MVITIQKSIRDTHTEKRNESKLNTKDITLSLNHKREKKEGKITTK